VRNDYSVSY